MKTKLREAFNKANIDIGECKPGGYAVCPLGALAQSLGHTLDHSSTSYGVVTFLVDKGILCRNKMFWFTGTFDYIKGTWMGDSAELLNRCLKAYEDHYEN